MDQLSDNPNMTQLLTDFKLRMKIYHSSEDETLKDILGASLSNIRRLIGDFDPDQCQEGKELVFERGRYAYNDALEYFYDNFQQRIMDLSFDLALKGGRNDTP